MTDKEVIKLLAAEELAAANEKNPQFHSQHEAYAVLKEEVEEMAEEVNECIKMLGDIWENTRRDRNCDHAIHLLKGHAIYAVQEAIQKCVKR